MKPYGQVKKLPASGDWKKDYHIYEGNKRLKNWWEDMCCLRPRTTIKKLVNDEINKTLKDNE